MAQADASPRSLFAQCDGGQPLMSVVTELSPSVVAQAIMKRVSGFFDDPEVAARLAQIVDKEGLLKAPATDFARQPWFCSGCPHNTSTRVPDGSRAVGGIGCHNMVTWMPGRNTATFTQMGGEGVPWVGQAPFTDEK